MRLGQQLDHNCDNKVVIQNDLLRPSPQYPRGPGTGLLPGIGTCIGAINFSP